MDHHGAIDQSDDPIDGIRAALWRSERQELATARLSGGAPALTGLPATLGRPDPDVPGRGVPLDDGIDLGW